MSDKKVPHRNPYVGGIMAALMLGFALFRFYQLFVLDVNMPTWRIVITVGIFLYGLYVLFDLLRSRK